MPSEIHRVASFADYSPAEVEFLKYMDEKTKQRPSRPLGDVEVSTPGSYFKRFEPPTQTTL